MPERLEGFDSPLAADQELIDATLKALIAEGPDAVSLVQLAELLNRDIDELQELFGHPGELLAQLWQSVLRLQWVEIMGLARRIFDGDLAAIHDVRMNLSLRRAAIHLIVVAHRYEELAEVIPNDVARQVSLLSESVTTSDIAATENARAADHCMIVGLLGWITGVLLDPRAGDEPSLNHLLLNHFHHRCWKTDHDQKMAERRPPQTLVFDQAGPLSGELLRASTSIVAQGGVGRATLARVARISGFPPEVVVGMYVKQENLHADFIESAVTSIFGYESVKNAVSDPLNAAVRLSVWLDQETDARRRALLEILVAGTFSPSIRNAYARVVHNIESVAHIHSQADHVIFESDFRRYAAVVRHICLGLGVIRENIGDLGIADWRPFSGIALGSDVRLTS